MSDPQIPFHHPGMLAFVKRVQTHFGILDENMYCVGDESDQYWGSEHPKDPDGHFSAWTELFRSKEIFKEMYALFPQMKLCTSNHGTRWMRKAFNAEIPSFMMRKYEEVIEAPDLWIWKDRWVIKERHPFCVEHGDRFSGAYPHVQGAMYNGLSTIIGHHHSIAGIEFIKTKDFDPEIQGGFDIWGMCTGSLIDFEAYAFRYGHKGRKKPKLGMGVVLDNGTWPIWVPFLA